ncbi:retrovirus-related pol polyprotein from transposon TNT 1-94 [Tanacetum coccineum]
MVESNRLGFQEKPRERMCIDFTLSQQAQCTLCVFKETQVKEDKEEDLFGSDQSLFVDLGFVVPVFSPGDDPIACLNKAMAFLTAIASSSTTYKGNATSSRGNNTSGQKRVVKCYNCQDEGHMARQCTQPKRPRNATWYKEKAISGIQQSQAQTVILTSRCFPLRVLEDLVYFMDCSSL